MSETEASVPPCKHDHTKALKQTVGEAPVPAGPLTCAVIRKLAEMWDEKSAPDVFAKRYLQDPTEELCKADDPTRENVVHAYAVYDPVVNVLARELGVAAHEFRVYTQPDPEDKDRALVVFRGFVVFQAVERACHRCWDSVADMEADLAETYAAMRERARTILKNEAKLKKMGLL